MLHNSLVRALFPFTAQREQVPLLNVRLGAPLLKGCWMIYGRHRVAISTPDLERITAFFREVLHFEPVAYAGGWKR